MVIGSGGAVTIANECGTGLCGGDGVGHAGARHVRGARDTGRAAIRVGLGRIQAAPSNSNPAVAWRGMKGVGADVASQQTRGG